MPTRGKLTCFHPGSRPFQYNAHRPESSSRTFRNSQEIHQGTTAVGCHSSFHIRASRIVSVVHPTARLSSSRQRRVTHLPSSIYRSSHSYHTSPLCSPIFSSPLPQRLLHNRRHHLVDVLGSCLLHGRRRTAHKIRPFLPTT